jgi:phosphoenolpyruvate carboxykinase (GTP)
MEKLLSVDVDGWLKEVADIRTNHYPKFGSHLPKELAVFLDTLEKNLNEAKAGKWDYKKIGGSCGCGCGC